MVVIWNEPSFFYPPKQLLLVKYNLQNREYISLLTPDIDAEGYQRGWYQKEEWFSVEEIEVLGWSEI